MVKWGLILVISMICSSCHNGTILFTEDFEKYNIGKPPGAPWNTTGNGTVIIDHQKSFSGNKSVHFITGEGTKNGAFIGIDHIFPLENNRYYGSLKMYVEEASPNGIHWTMIQSSGNVKNEDFLSEIRYGGQYHKQLMANYETKGIKTDCWQHSEVKIPEKKWFTLQWFFDGDAHTMKLWLDGALIDAITVVEEGTGCIANETYNKWKFPVMENVLLGWVDYQTGGGIRKIWIDDVILSTEMLSK